MSVLVVARDPRGGIVIGSDEQTTVEQHFAALRASKWVVTDNWAMGAAGWGFVRSLLNWHINDLVDGLPVAPNAMTFLSSGLKRLFKDNGLKIAHSGDDQHGPECWFGEMLIANAKGDLYVMSGAFEMNHIRNWFTIGSGQEVASGAMYALWEAVKSGQIAAEQAVRVSVAAAIEMIVGCGGNVVVRRLWAPARRRIPRETTDETNEDGEVASAGESAAETTADGEEADDASEDDGPRVLTT